MEIPYERLAPETLRSVLEDFVTRDGTDYGAHEYTLDDKVALVMRQLKNGTAVIVFHAESESVTVVTKQDAAKM